MFARISWTGLRDHYLLSVIWWFSYLCYSINKLVSWNQSQQVHTEPPLLLESAASRPVLYTIGVVSFVLFCWWWAWWRPKHFETPVNKSSSASSRLFIHLHDITIFRATRYETSAVKCFAMSEAGVVHSVWWLTTEWRTWIWNSAKAATVLSSAFDV
jgi:hypothetical protein